VAGGTVTTNEPRYRSTGVNAGLTLDDVVNGAIAHIESEGIETLTMRRLATALEVTPMSIYRHVANKHSLLSLVAERYLADLPRPATSNAQTILYETFVSLYAVIVEHPVVASVLIDQPLDNPVGWKLADQVFGVLIADGWDPRLVRETFTALLTFTIGFAVVRRGRTSLPDGSAPHPVEGLAAEYPHLSGIAGDPSEWLATSSYQGSLRRIIDSFSAERK
jgi:AcrR family transcriptional regulator